MAGSEVDTQGEGLLQPEDGPPVTVHEARGDSPFLLVCEHAGNRIPRRLNHLGLPPAELVRHIAWDIGTADVARSLARRLGCTLILQNFSRLVCDCNRAVAQADFIPRVSDGTTIPGNQDLSERNRRLRIREIYEPFHARVAAAIEARERRQEPTWLVAIHSFTPVLGSESRPWDVGVLYEEASFLSAGVLAGLRSVGAYCIGDNEPYSLQDVYSETMQRHGTLQGLSAVEIEVRQDHILDRAAAVAWAATIHEALRPVSSGAPRSFGRRSFP